MVAEALQECPLGGQWVIRKDGDGMTIVVPPAVSKEEVIGEFPPRVDRGLRRSNARLTPEARLRIRMAVTHGDVVVDEDDLIGGPALVEAARIRDIAPLRRAMNAAPGAFVGLVLADHVYRTSVLEGDPALMPQAYRKVVAKAKEYREPAWIRLWGAELPAEGAPDGPDTGPTEPGPRSDASDVPDGDAGRRIVGDVYDTRVGTVNGPFVVGKGATSHTGTPHGR
ncbi:hypothetical protein AB0J68_09105 [Micromonospora sp. NPDC049580]|uniref:hypothetical protein n=1 Tax=Micromonospora sp. NPDC049580 TaxID=3154832 RepID=UPI0034294253